MKIYINQGQVKFELIDKTGKVYGSHEFDTSGELECDIPLDIYLDDHEIRLVPKVTMPPSCQEFTIDGGDYRNTIDTRAKDIGYDPKVGPLYP